MILFLRSLIFFIGQTLAAIIIGLLGLLLFFSPFLIRYRFITLWSHFVIRWAKIVCGIHYRVHGVEHLPHRAAVVLCKHQSAWETLFLQTLLPPQCWVLKKQLLHIPFFGWGLRLLEPIAIDRSKSRSILQLLTQGKARLSQNRWIVIFPEGSRIPVGQTGRYSRSGVVLAKEAQVPIVLIAHNAGKCWPRNAFIKHPGIIDVIISPVLDPASDTIDALQAKAQRWIEDTSRNL